MLIRDFSQGSFSLQIGNEKKSRFKDSQHLIPNNAGYFMKNCDIKGNNIVSVKEHKELTDTGLTLEDNEVFHYFNGRFIDEGTDSVEYNNRLFVSGINANRETYLENFKQNVNQFPTNGGFVYSVDGTTLVYSNDTSIFNRIVGITKNNIINATHLYYLNAEQVQNYNTSTGVFPLTKIINSDGELYFVYPNRFSFGNLSETIINQPIFQPTSPPAKYGFIAYNMGRLSKYNIDDVDYNNKWYELTANRIDELQIQGSDAKVFPLNEETANIIILDFRLDNVNDRLYFVLDFEGAKVYYDNNKDRFVGLPQPLSKLKVKGVDYNEDVHFPTNQQLIVSPVYNQIGDPVEVQEWSAEQTERVNTPITMNIKLVERNAETNNNNNAIQGTHVKDYQKIINDPVLIQTTATETKQVCIARQRRYGIFGPRDCIAYGNEEEYTRTISKLVGFQIAINAELYGKYDVFIQSLLDNDDKYYFAGTIDNSVSATNSVEVRNVVNISPTTIGQPSYQYGFTQNAWALPKTSYCLAFGNKRNGVLGKVECMQYDTGTELKELPSNAQLQNGRCSVRYTYTYYNSEEDIESLPAEISDEVVLTTDNDVILSGFRRPDNYYEFGIDTIKIYRLCPELGETSFVSVGRLSIFDSNPNYPDKLTPADFGLLVMDNQGRLVSVEDDNDRSKDVIIVDQNGIRNKDVLENDPRYLRYLESDTDLLDTTRNSPFPVDGSNIIFAYGRLWCIQGNRVRYSEAGYPDYWSEFNFIRTQNEDDITGLALIPEGILIFTKHTTNLLTGTTPQDFALRVVSTEQGCISANSVQFINNAPIWISNDGICVYTNGGIRVISKDRIGKFTLSEQVRTAVYDEQYFVVDPNDGNPAEGKPSTRCFFALDLRFNRAAFMNYDANLRYIYATDDDRLLGITNDNKIVELFAGDNEIAHYYISPVILGQDITDLLYLTKLFVRAEKSSPTGDYLLSMTAYDKSGSDDTAIRNLSLEDKYDEIELPTYSIFGIQLEVLGKGKLHGYNIPFRLREETQREMRP